MQDPHTESHQDASEHPDTGNDLVSSEDAERFNGIVGRMPDPIIPDVDALNGLLTALVCSPRLLPPDKIMIFIMSSNSGKGELQFESPEEVQWLMEFVNRHVVDLHYVLSDDSRRYKPCIRCETRPGNHWARGFTAAVSGLHKDWEGLMNDQACGVSMKLISSLAFEHREDPSQRLVSTEEIGEGRTELIQMLPGTVKLIYDYFADQRKATGQNYPKYLSARKISFVDPANDSDPEVRRIKKKFGLEDYDFSPDSGGNTGGKQTKKKKSGKTKRRRW